jgi:hypothetical protein
VAQEANVTITGNSSANLAEHDDRHIIDLDAFRHPGSSPNCEIALRHAANGNFVFPCNPDPGPEQKRPLFGLSWPAGSTTDEDQIKQWWRDRPDALPAIDCGKSGLLVIDPDRKHSIDGVKAWTDLVIQNGGKPEDWPVSHTPNNGQRVFFRQPDGEAPGNRKGDLPKGMEVRGDGGYVIAPGTRLSDGRVYQYDGPPIRADRLQQPPRWLIDTIRGGRHRGNPSHLLYLNGGSRERAYARAALDKASAELAASLPGNRNETLNAKAFSMGRMVGAGWLDRAEVADALWQASGQNGLLADKGSNSVQATLASGLEAGIREPHAPLSDDGWSPRAERSAPPPEGNSKPHRRLTVIDPATWQGQPKPERAWIVRDMIPASTVSLLAGDGAIGKSILGLMLGTARALGRDWIGTVPSRQNPVSVR